MGLKYNYPWTYTYKFISYGLYYPSSQLSLVQETLNDTLERLKRQGSADLGAYDYISEGSIIECEISTNRFYQKAIDSKGNILLENGTDFNVSNYGAPFDFNTTNPISSNLPTISINGLIIVNHPVGWDYEDDGATASNADGDSILVNVSGTVNSNVIGTYLLSYTASDVNDNEAIPITRTVNIVEGNLLDSDLDGINDSAEITNGLDPFDGTDALLDPDNDGVSNVVEINAGSDINVDDQPPVFTSFVYDLEVISTGLTTTVELVNPTASDVNSDVVVTNDSNGEFPVGITTVTYTATDSSGNAAILTQQINVLPYIVISPGQTLGDGQTVNVNIILNVTPAAYPVTGNIIVGGTASSDDFILSTTSISITEGLTQTIELTAIDDGFGDSDEILILSLAINNRNNDAYLLFHKHINTFSNLEPSYIPSSKSDMLEFSYFYLFERSGV